MTVARSVADVVAGARPLRGRRASIACTERVCAPSAIRHGLIGSSSTTCDMQVASTAPLAKISAGFTQAVRSLSPRSVPFPGSTSPRASARTTSCTSTWPASSGSEGVVFIGRAQEKTKVFRTEKRRDAGGHRYPWVVKTTGVVNHFYFYCVDEDFGPFSLKFCSYFPYTAKLCINGNHWAQQQAAKVGLAFTPMDNGFADIEAPHALQAICDRFGPQQIDELLFKWLAILPDPFTDYDRAAGYGYDVSILQAEFSLTQMLDTPLSGRVFFEHVIRDNLDTGRPDQVSLIFDRQIQRGRRHPTPSRFRTRIITDGVTPSLHVDYKHTQIKQYHKEGRALRTETTINDPGDFDIGKRLVNLPALREIGFSANRRLLGAQRLAHDPIAGTTALDHVTKPLTASSGTRVSGLPLGDPRSHALLHALELFRLTLPGGFRNADLRTLVAQPAACPRAPSPLAR